MTHMTNIKDLNHVERTLPGNGKIVVIDPGATLGADALAMIQALHSRSVGGVTEHLEVLAEKGAEKFMASYYVGYGHKSIGDCGSVVVFIEGVSMLAAKAVQDFALYNGQEASTRYIDFAEQTFINPLGNKEGTEVLEAWRSFYLAAMPQMVEALKERFPLGEGEKEGIYNKAIAARAFDILRGFLPAGASTNLAWSGTIRQFNDRLIELRHHPLEEVRTIATELEDALIEAYPSSFDPEKKRYEATENYMEQAAKEYYYHNPDSPEMSLTFDGIDTAALAPYQELIAARPNRFTEPPRFLKGNGQATFEFTLDFGSFRDIQRHRAVSQRMPLLTDEIGFHEWYLGELPNALQAEAKALLAQQKEAVAALSKDQYLRQYYLPMGYKTSNRLSGDLPALVYLAELRSSSTVHPTLVERAQAMGKILEEQYGQATGLKVFLDPDPGRFDVKRGEHDIVKVEE